MGDKTEIIEAIKLMLPVASADELIFVYYFLLKR